MEQKKTVLIVEDEKNIVDIIRFNLQRTGYNTLEAYDGEAGLAMAREKKPVKSMVLRNTATKKVIRFRMCYVIWKHKWDNYGIDFLKSDGLYHMLIKKEGGKSGKNY